MKDIICRKNDGSFIDALLEKNTNISSINNNCIFNFNTDYSKSIYRLYNHSNVPKYGGLIEYQDEELIYGDKNTFTAKYLPFSTHVCIKFYSEELSHTVKLWYQDIAPFLLSQRVMPNIDISIEIGHVNLKYDSRFAKYLNSPDGIYPKQIHFMSTPDMGKSLHQLIDAEALSEADIFEVCKQVDAMIDIYTRIGLSHGDLTCDNIRIINLKRIYNCKISEMLIFTNYLAISCNFHNMFIVKNSILHSLLEDENRYNIRYDSAGRYNYNTFYLSLLYILDKTIKYNTLRKYLTSIVLIPLNTINSQYDFKLTTIFNVKEMNSAFINNSSNEPNYSVKFPPVDSLAVNDIKQRKYSLSKSLPLVSFGKTLLPFTSTTRNHLGNFIKLNEDMPKKVISTPFFNENEGNKLNMDDSKNEELELLVMKYIIYYKYDEIEEEDRKLDKIYNIIFDHNNNENFDKSISVIKNISKKIVTEFMDSKSVGKYYKIQAIQNLFLRIKPKLNALALSSKEPTAELNDTIRYINETLSYIQKIDPTSFKKKSLSDVISDYKAYESKEKIWDNYGREYSTRQKYSDESHAIETITEIINIIKPISTIVDNIKVLKNTIALAVGLLKILNRSNRFDNILYFKIINLFPKNGIRI